MWVKKKLILFRLYYQLHQLIFRSFKQKFLSIMPYIIIEYVKI